MRIIKHMGTRIFWEPLDSPYDDLPAMKFPPQKNKPNSRQRRKSHNKF